MNEEEQKITRQIGTPDDDPGLGPDIEQTIFAATICANEFYSAGEVATAIIFLREIDRLCDEYKIEMPAEAISLNIELDERCGTAIL